MNGNMPCITCGGKTDDKPYCIDHLSKISYVAGLEYDLELLEREADGLAPIDVDGIGCQDVLILVRERGAISVQEMSILLKRDALRHVRALERAERVIVTKIRYRPTLVVRERRS